MSTPRPLLRLLILALLGLLAAPAARADDDPVVAPRRWADLEFLSSALDVACDAVEKECGATYPERPKIRITTSKEMITVLIDEMSGILRNMSNMGDEQIKLVCQVLSEALAAKYEPSTNTIHVMPENIRKLSKAAGMPGAANERSARVLLAHEATHALDFQRFPALERERQGRKTEEGVQAVGAVLEGHAQFVAERVAASWDLGEDFVTFTKLITSGILTDDPAVKITQDSMLAEHRFAYVQGHEFMKAVFAAHGRKGLDAVLGAPPATAREIERPTEYLGTTQAPAALDAEPLFAHFRPLFEGPGWSVRTQPIKNIQMAGIFNSLPAERTTPIFKKLDSTIALIATNGVTGRIGTLILMQYADREGAADHLAITEELLHKKDELLADSDSITIDKVVYEKGIGPSATFPGLFCEKQVTASGQHQTIVMHAGHAGAIAFEFTLIQPNLSRAVQDAYMGVVMASLLGKDTAPYLQVAEEARTGQEREVVAEEPVIRDEEAPATPAEVQPIEETPAAAVKALIELATELRAAQADGDEEALRDLGRALLPSRAELASLLRDDEAGRFFLAGYKGPLQGADAQMDLMAGKNLFQSAPENTVLRAYHATTEQLAAGPVDEFPGGMQRFAKEVAAAGRTWFVFECAEPGKTDGRKYSVFTRVGARFVFVAKPWRGLPAETPK